MSETPDLPQEAQDANFRPLTRVERRNLWLHEYGEQDIALQAWVRLAEQSQLEIEVMLQLHGLLVFGTLVSTATYAQFYIDLHEQMYRQVYRYAHLRDVTLMSAGHKIKLPYWRGRLGEVDAFVVGASAGDS